MALLVCWLVVTCLYSSVAQTRIEPRKQEGDSCELKDGREGICRALSSCKYASDRLSVERPVNCGFKGHAPIVCCIDDVQMSPDEAQERADEKCREFSKSVTYTGGVLPLLPEAIPSTIETAKCDFGELPLIVGGEETKAGEFPHMTALGYKDGQKIAWLCGGSLISDQFVMTAAHCIVNRAGPPVVARLGELNLKRDDDGAHPQDYAVSSAMKHPDYRPASRYNDIALLRLSRSVQFSDRIRPACLYPDETFYVNKTLATGWGRLGFGQEASDILMKVGLDIITNEKCDRLFQSLKGTPSLSVGIAPTMLCAGVLTGGKDTCQGDSGGPIQIVSQHNKCMYYVIGVTSFGKYCAVENAPGVYSRVSRFLPWIVSVVWP